jgi:hypothetical protein
VWWMPHSRFKIPIVVFIIRLSAEFVIFLSHVNDIPILPVYQAPKLRDQARRRNSSVTDAILNGMPGRDADKRVLNDILIRSGLGSALNSRIAQTGSRWL